MPARVVAIFGPTTSGKTAVAITLALAIDGEIISADSMQVYAGLERLTNQPTDDERRGVPHHLVGHVDPWSGYDVARFAAEAHAVIDDVLARGRTPIVVGGSGLYLRAALAELAFPPRADAAERQRIQSAVEQAGPVAAHARLVAIDPAAAARIPAGDTRRIVRALELAELGASLAPAGRDALWAADARHATRSFGLLVPRAVLHERINARTPRLLAEGGIAEVAALLADSRPLSTTMAKAHGVGDVTALLAGEIDAVECERLLATRTRQYAKRQDTWLRKLPTAELVPGDRAAAAVATEIAARLAG